ncbi:ribonuclease Z [Allokutzneria sp. A3M-2-11 16]|uniref:ribonuclease Z n=1 Tax=Allokutzneria sp. A3M-2-11 16 TaxID=2962043 RepID=UPI0020B81C99|nr:ribonuclease Z [Allokutzneria sp. A3M-2-11 16]MCP3804548.1 ribonuclease Z [Allokutzneria sp. A3M-2-11 16]
MSSRELVVLGTASQVPTRQRAQNGYLLRWDGVGLLFDPGEGTQRQMLLAGVAASEISRICLTHFHGDHCLGVPGIVQRLSLDRVAHPVHAHYPASGREYFRRLRNATAFYEVADLREEPVHDDGPIATLSTLDPASGSSVDFGTLSARRLEHSVESFGYRLTEPDGRRMLPDRLAAAGISGRHVREVQRAGFVAVDGRRVELADVSEARPGQSFAFVMDTRLCDGVFALADGVDMLVIESTFLAPEAELARHVGHLTAADAGRVAAECGVRTLVLTHFSQRYPDPRRFHEEAAAVFGGEIVVAEDLSTVPMPKRR